jgi:hypothetical protein
MNYWSPCSTLQLLILASHSHFTGEAQRCQVSFPRGPSRDLSRAGFRLSSLAVGLWPLMWCEVCSCQIKQVRDHFHLCPISSCAALDKGGQSEPGSLSYAVESQPTPKWVHSIRLRSSYLHLPSNWDYRCVPCCSAPLVFLMMQNCPPRNMFEHTMICLVTSLMESMHKHSSILLLKIAR